MWKTTDEGDSLIFLPTVDVECSRFSGGLRRHRQDEPSCFPWQIIGIFDARKNFPSFFKKYLYAFICVRTRRNFDQLFFWAPSPRNYQFIGLFGRFQNGIRKSKKCLGKNVLIFSFFDPVYPTPICVSDAILTSEGSGDGAPCVFPFVFHGKKRRDCQPSNTSRGFTWCATTDNFDRDKRWGYCIGSK